MTKRHRILHCITSLHNGGANHLLIRNLLHLDQEQFEHFVCYLVPRHDLRPLYRAVGIEPICVNHRGGIDGPRTFYRLVNLIRTYHIELVHTNLWLDRVYAGLAAAWCRVPVVTTLHASAVGEQPIGWWRRIIARSRALTEDAIGRLQTRCFVAVSQAVRETHVAARWIPSNRIEVVYSGLPLDNFDQKRIDTEYLGILRRELRLEGAYPVLLNVGRLHSVKGQRYLIPMMAQILQQWPQARLLIVGEGGERARLTQDIKNHQLEHAVHLLGYQADPVPFLHLADVFVFPSLSEGLPLALLEAMAAAKPVVASDIPALREVVKPGVNGYLVEPRNPDAFVRGVEQVLCGVGRAEAMGRASRRIVEEKFEMGDSIKRLEKLYLAML